MDSVWKIVTDSLSVSKSFANQSHSSDNSLIVERLTGTVTEDGTNENEYVVQAFSVLSRFFQKVSINLQQVL